MTDSITVLWKIWVDGEERYQAFIKNNKREPNYVTIEGNQVQLKDWKDSQNRVTKFKKDNSNKNPSTVKLTIPSTIIIQETGKLYFKQGKDNRCTYFPNKKIDSKAQNYVYGFYFHPKTNSQGSPNTVSVGLGDIEGNPDYKVTKIFIDFKKTENGKTYYSTKTFENKQIIDNSIHYEPKNNYKPDYCIVYYQKIKK